MGGTLGSQNVCQMHAFKLRSRDETGDAEMGTTRQKNKNKNVSVNRKETSVATMRIYVNDLGTE